MDDCLTGRNAIPDHREKIHDWDVFTDLILSTWIRRFTEGNERANEIARRWAEVVTAAFADGHYDHTAYEAAYRNVLNPRGGRLVGLANFYPVSIVRDCLDPRTENAFVGWLLHQERGVYYIYDGLLSNPPTVFESRETSRYLSAIELLARYPHAREQLGFVVDWLNGHRRADGIWDMGKAVNDKLCFPLSDSWRRQETREADCTYRIFRLIRTLTDKGE